MHEIGERDGGGLGGQREREDATGENEENGGVAGPAGGPPRIGAGVGGGRELTALGDINASYVSYAYVSIRIRASVL